ncbi:MAG TPA: DUF1549 domain-containing protein, partial [Pirellulaceae bacterium]|nr:DUF1549 domain-containing protein [Pirellulaceae bacterium]
MIARFRLLALPKLAHSTLAVALLTVVSGSSVAVAEEFDGPALEFFEKQVRPILAQRCLECHSGKLEEPKGGLRLDSREATLKGGDTDAAIVPGKPHESLLIGAINWGDDYQMPPKSKMPAEEIAVLTKWVEMGAPWPKEAPPANDKASKVFNLAERKASHWCWQPIVQPAIPNVKQSAWVKSPIDAFILAKLEEKGLAPNPAADKRVLIRRAYFDLIGLPPTPEQVHAFVQDNSPEAFAKVVDGLLKSPQFGERWGRHWLDLMRYGESRGHEFDYDIPNAWHYRDYVIRALNADLPYDQFVTEHIAGDLLAQPRINPEEGYNESVLGTGFWFLGEWVHSPVDIRKDECDRFDNMVDTFSKTFLGLTVSCARCHDHKFDAISQKDYYALFGYLQSSDYRQARFDTEQSHREIASQLQTLDQSFLDKEVTPLLAKSHNDAKTVANDLLAAREAIQAGASSKNVAPLEAIAKARGSDVVRLQAWVTYLEQAKDNPRDLLHTWAKLAYDPQAAAPNRITELLRPAREAADKRAAALQAAWQNATLVADYTRDTPLNADGPAFIKVPAGQAIFAWKREQPLLAATELYGSVRRDYRWSQLAVSPGVVNDIGAIGGWNRAGNSFRTPTFEVRKGPVAYLVKGGGRAFAAIDSHRLLQGPLHGQAVKEWNDAPTDEPRWITQNLEAYVGHRIHLEFTPKGEEELQVLMVVAGPPPAEPLPKAEDLLPLTVTAEQQASLEAFASAVAQLATAEPKDARYARS